MSKKLYFSFYVLFWCTLGALAQETPAKLSLEEAIDYGLQNNRNAKNAVLDIDAAKKQKWETTAIGLPQINGKIDYQNWLRQQFEGVDFNQDGVIDFGAKQSVNATATLTQLLFDGSYLVGLQSAKVFLEISKNAKVKTDLEVRKNIIKAYGNALLADESIRIYENNITLLKKNVNETSEIYQNGLTEEENVEQLQITLKQLENGLNNALRIKKIAYQVLNLSLGLELTSSVNLTQNLEDLTTNNIQLDLLDQSTSIEQTIDYKIAANDRRSKELLLKLERSRALPSLSAFINGSYIANNNEFDFLNDEQKWVGTSMFGLSLNIPLFSSFQWGAKTKRAKINLDKAENNLTEIEQNLRFDIATAKSNYQFSIDNYHSTKENLKLAERIEQKNQTKFLEGLASSFDLRQAQQQLYSLQQDYLQSMIEVINKKAELETLTNATK